MYSVLLRYGDVEFDVHMTSYAGHAGDLVLGCPAKGIQELNIQGVCLCLCLCLCLCVCVCVCVCLCVCVCVCIMYVCIYNVCIYNVCMKHV